MGFTIEENIASIQQEKSGIAYHEEQRLFKTPFYASLINSKKLAHAFEQLNLGAHYTKLEQLLLLSLQKTIHKSQLPISNKTALIIATTKGNIDLLQHPNPVIATNRVYLPELGRILKDAFGFHHEPIIVSNACVSGVSAISVAKRLIKHDLYDHAYVVGGDVVSEFVLSGFNSFQALSSSPCKPFSKNRNGITLGDATACAAITFDSSSTDAIEIIGDGSCNDANHISGPSRTGEGLYRSIQTALNEADIAAKEIDYISAHGTATLYNDEMEAIAFNRCQMSHIPLNSLKGYYGHTLGASALVETIIGLESMKRNTLFTSLGMDELGVSQPLSIIQQQEKKEINLVLKTASGFGGCNTAVLFRKISIE